MEIKPSSSYSPIPPTDARPIRRAVQAATDGGEFASTEALQRALNATPDIRPEAVERGRALAASEHYPPAETMQRLARLFVGEFSAQPPLPAAQP
jgi:hypothetical protein